MERVEMNEEALEQVTGGTIFFSEDLSTCGRGCDNQYQVKNYGAVMKFYTENCTKMTEYQMLKKMAELGYLSKL